MSKYTSGQSGNPAGRPKGIKDKRTALADLLKPHAEELVAKAVELARSGDVNALRLCIERLIPKASSETTIKFPDISKVNGNLAFEVCKQVLAVLSGQEINFDQAKVLINFLKYYKENAPSSINDTVFQEVKEALEDALEKRKYDY